MTSFPDYDSAASIDIEIAKLREAMKLPQSEESDVYVVQRNTVILSMQELIDELEAMIKSLDQAKSHCKVSAVEQSKRASIAFSKGNFGECFQCDVEKKVNQRMVAMITPQIEVLASKVQLYKVRLQQLKIVGNNLASE